jgi:hypothetical protein
VITFTPSPIVNAGPDGSVCNNNSIISLNGSVTGATGAIWSGGAGVFTPNNTTLTATYTPTAAERAAGTVTLTLTSAGNGNCNAVSDAVTYTITPAPTANAGADQTLCSNNAIATLGGSFTVATGGIWSGGNGSFSPSTTNMNATYTPTAAEIANGNVTLTLTTTGNGTCVAVTDQVQINYTPSPTANAGPDLSLCRNNAAVPMGGSVTVATGGIWSGGAGSFTPNNTTLNATYTPTPAELAAGTLTLTLTTTGNGNCTAVSDSRVITFTPSPTVDAGANATVCANNSAITLNGSFTGSTGAIWSGGTGTYNPNSSTMNAVYTPSAAERTAGTVTLTLTTAGNGNCNAVSDNVTFTITPSPTANAVADRTVCANNAAVALNGSFTVATGGVWSGGAGTFDPSTTNMGAIYTPSAAEIANGFATLTLTTTGNGTCIAVADQMTISITRCAGGECGCGHRALREQFPGELERQCVRCDRRCLERWIGNLQPEQYNAQRDLHAKCCRTGRRYGDSHVDEHGQWFVQSGLKQSYDQLHASSNSQRWSGCECVFQQCEHHLERCLHRCHRCDLERWFRNVQSEQRYDECGVHTERCGARSRHRDLDVDDCRQRILQRRERCGDLHDHADTDRQRWC